MKQRIDKYVDAYIAELRKGMPMPSSGDCWYCLMRDADGKVLGDLSDGGVSHLLAHMEDRYYVPSLAINALRERGYRDVGIMIHLDMNPDTNTMGKPDGTLYDNVKRDIRNYMRKRLIPAAPTK